MTDLGRKDRTKTVPPISHRLMAHVDPAFVKQILNIAQRERKPDVQHQRRTDNFGRGFEIAEGVGGHGADITKSQPRAQRQVFSDTAIGSMAACATGLTVQAHERANEDDIAAVGGLVNCTKADANLRP